MADNFRGLQNINHNAKESYERKIQERKRNIVYLIKNYLQEAGLEKSAETLTKEGNLSDQIEVCDNIDLDTIIQEYCSFYFAKFNKYPKLCKKLNADQVTPKKNQPKRLSVPNLDVKPSKDRPKSKEHSEGFEISIKQISNVKLLESNYVEPEDIEADTPEMKELVEVIKKEMVTKDLGVSWNDCIGLDKVIQLLKEAVVYPHLYPSLFENKVTPWKGILLYGPPGTGKTLVAKALASECKTVFINVSPSTFISKWRGESEKLVRTLFEVAKFYAPTTIFIDELDALGSNRDEVQHEASKRFKSELLTQMDGLYHNNEKVFILATTNIPWAVDQAILRRFEKRMFVKLPDVENRVKLFDKYLDVQGNFIVSCDEDDKLKFANATPYFTGSDIKTVCKDACMRVVRRQIKKLEDMKRERGVGDNNIVGFKSAVLSADDVRCAISNTKPLEVNIEKYIDWDNKFGCV